MKRGRSPVRASTGKVISLTFGPPAPVHKPGETEMNEMPGMFRDWKDAAQVLLGIAVGLVMAGTIVYLAVKGIGLI